LVNKSSTRLPNLNHDATANAALGEPGLARHGRKLSPIEVALQPLPRRSTIGNRTHDGVDADKRSTTQDKRRDRSRQIHAARQSTGATVPPQRVIESTLASMVERTASMPPAKRPFPSGFVGALRSMISVASKLFR
jgi:hypothetical protein